MILTPAPDQELEPGDEIFLHYGDKFFGSDTKPNLKAGKSKAGTLDKIPYSESLDQHSSDETYAD